MWCSCNIDVMFYNVFWWCSGCSMIFFWCSHGIHVMFCDVFRMFTSNKWDVSRLSLSIHIVSVKYFMVYLGCLSSFYFYVVLFGVLVFPSLYLSITFDYYLFYLFYLLHIFSIFHDMSHDIFLSKTILLFDDILSKIFKINVTICNVFICAWARIIYMPLKKHACIFMGVLINKYTISVRKRM